MNNGYGLIIFNFYLGFKTTVGNSRGIGTNKRYFLLFVYSTSSSASNGVHIRGGGRRDTNFRSSIFTIPLLMINRL